MTTGPAVLQMTVHQYRRLYVAAGVYLVVLCAIGLMPLGAFSPGITALLMTPFAGVLLISMVAFINPDADLNGPGSHYPAFLLRLPVRTRTLALWPMIAGSLWSGLSWIAVASLFMRPRGLVVPLLWPAVALVSIVLCMQALMWSPFRIGMLRLVLILAIPTALVISGVWLGGTGTPENQMAAFYGLVAVGGAVGAWVGIVRARTAPAMGGRRERAEQPLALPTRRKAKAVAPFRSPLQAQVWMEWRQQGRLLPMITTVIMVMASLPLIWEKDLSMVPELNNIELRPWIIGMFFALPTTLVLFAAVVGMGARRPNMRNSDGAYHLFYATRPLRSSDILRAKIRAFSIGTVLSWGIVLATMLAWLSLPARHGGVVAPGIVLISGWVMQHGDLLAAVGFGLVALTWRNQLVGAFVDYAPARWIVVGYPLMVTSIGALCFGTLTSSRTLQTESVGMLAGGLGAILLVKLAVAGFSANGILRRCPQDARDVLLACGYWAAGSAVVSALLIWIAGHYESGIAVTKPPVLILLAMFLVPLARPMYARYCLEVGRHR